MGNTNLETLRSKAIQLYVEYEAIYCLIGGMTTEYRRKFDLTKEKIKTLTRPALRKFISDITKEIILHRRLYGARASNNEFLVIFDKAREAANGKACLIPKHMLKDLFAHYEKVIPNFDSLREHTRIAIDLGTFRERPGSVELYLLEAILFEDICALFNLCLDYKSKVTSKSPKVFIKTTDALFRATVTATYFFVEAYLNGIAFDFYIRKENQLDEKTKSLLTEWDFKNGREKYISLREKCLQYPKIITGAAHPPLQESNCPELDYFLKKAKFLRDSIVHASPKQDMQTYDPVKEKVFYDSNSDELEMIIDNSILLVERIEGIIRGDLKCLWWLAHRDNNGYFSEHVFN